MQVGIHAWMYSRVQVWRNISVDVLMCTGLGVLM